LSTNTAAKPRGTRVATPSSYPIRVSEDTIEQLTEVFQLLADKSRIKILLALAREGEVNVSTLCHLLKQSQPAVSHHLTLLRKSKLVGFRRDGKHNFYHLRSGHLCQLLEQLFTESGNSHRQIHLEGFTLVYKRHR
jgi:ArsR family transcriptional regulator